MANLVLTRIAGAIGSRLPAPLRAVGTRLLNRGARALARRIDDALFGQTDDGPRLEGVRVLDSAEGAPLARVFGRVRVGGHLIWSARLKERRVKSSAGGKGGPRNTEAAYSLTFAVALGHGPVRRIERVWADGRPLDLAQISWRLHAGTSDQAPDPAIEAVEGQGNTPAYRGIAYVVFEDFALEAFGNRLPQLTFELVAGQAQAQDHQLEQAVRSVCLIPGAGEFTLDPEPVVQILGPGRVRTQNQHVDSARTDFDIALERLLEDAPGLQAVHLVIGWFGSGLAAGTCRVEPRAESRDKVTFPHQWQVNGRTRANAGILSQIDGRPAYGGTPDDASVVRAIGMLKDKGLAVTLLPFLFIDAPGYPWRGRITPAGEADVTQFFGAGGYGDFVTHVARLSVAAGGVEAVLLGSEMVALTHWRSSDGRFPAVDALRGLAAQVRAIVGQGTLISYAADWTEYGARVDANGDVDFPLDSLWADPNIDFVGIDQYAPLTDLRGQEVADAQMLAAGIEGGEGFDWYYASPADRQAGLRTPITGGAGQPWVFRQKDLRNWWSNLHRPMRAGQMLAASAWVPGSKPIRLCELGVGAVDKGSNRPSAFPDPKSIENSLPEFSSGARDDLGQRLMLETVLDYWHPQNGRNPVHPQSGVRMIDWDRIALWCRDARPFPAFPALDQVWADGPNWARGHWLDGRMGQSSLAAAVLELCAIAGLARAQVDVTALDGVIDGWVLDEGGDVAQALAQLMGVFGLVVFERDGRVVFAPLEARTGRQLAPSRLAQPQAAEPIGWQRGARTSVPGFARLTYLDAARDYAPAMARVQADPDLDDALPADADSALSLSSALVLAPDQAQALARSALARARMAQVRAQIELPVNLLDIGAGSCVTFDEAEVFRVLDVRGGAVRQARLMRVGDEAAGPRAAGLPTIQLPGSGPTIPQVLLLDLPPMPGEEADARALVAADADPWPGILHVRALQDGFERPPRARLTRPAYIGRTLTSLPPGPIGREQGFTFEAAFARGVFASVTADAMAAGANAFALAHDWGWEIVQCRQAHLVAPGVWAFSGLLRGQRGSSPDPAPALAAGAQMVALDSALERLECAAEEAQNGLDLVAVQPGQTLRVFDVPLSLPPGRRADLPPPPAGVRARRMPDTSVVFEVMARARQGADSLDQDQLALDAGLGQDPVQGLRVVLGGVERLIVGSGALVWPGAPPGESAQVEAWQVHADGRAGLAWRGAIPIG